LIKKNGNVENALATLGAKDAPTFDIIKEIRMIFLDPVVKKEYSLEWPGSDNEKVIRILCDKHQFKIDRVEPVLAKFSNVEQMMKQKTLF
jgi:hypothetical protein